MIQAMTSGHGGSMCTLHANSAADALNRLETMALMSQVELPLHALRSQISSAIDIIVQMSRQIGGRRLVTQIAEVLPLGDAGHYQVRDLFRLQEVDGQDGAAGDGEQDGRMQLKWTGAQPSLVHHLRPEHRKLITPLTAPIFEAPATAEA